MEAPPPIETPQTRRIRVLLLEDDSEVLLRIRAILENSALGEFDVHHVAEVEDALVGLQRGDHDALMLDVGLSDGFEALSRVRIAAPGVPVIALLPQVDEDGSLRALRLGAQDTLVTSKLEPRFVVRTLLHAVERHRLLHDLEDARKREHFVATHDRLTGLPNRYAILSFLRRALAFAARYRHRLALLQLDIDRFKTLNDTLGHAAGDELLVELSRRLRQLVRKSDMVARLSGDEFLLLIQSVEGEHAPAKVAENVMNALSEPFRAAGRECWLTGSVGIAVFPANGSDADTLVQNADTAMYQAKRDGKNCFRFFDQSMNESARRRLGLESRLRHAFENGELEVHYQPQVDASQGRIIGAEALLRWNDSELGRVAPQEFIHVAEETGLIAPLGAWVMREACREAKEWHLAGFPELFISVNLSTLQLDRDRLREVVVDALWQTNLPAEKLELELTENALIENRSEKVQLLSDLKRLGVGLALDDFGTGFSSLAYLKSIPVDRLKIDSSFVRDMTLDGDDAAIVEAVISIADKFGLRVIAEGVETTDQHDILRSLGCREMQGFHFSAAVPSEAFRALLAKGTL